MAVMQGLGPLIFDLFVCLDVWVLKLNQNSEVLSFFSVKKEEELKRSLEEKNSQIYIRRSQASFLSLVHTTL